jgi:arginase
MTTTASPPRGVTILGVPSSAGAHAPGQEQAPGALRAAGLVDALRRRGIRVRDDGDTQRLVARPDLGPSTARNAEAVIANATAVRDRVAWTTAQGDVALVIGGDCTLLVGVVAALDGRVGVAYIDGDADLDVPGAGWGIFDSMGAAHLVGLGEPGLSRLGPRMPLVAEEDLVLFGYHPAQLSPAQATLLRELAVRRHPVTGLDDPVEAARAARDALTARVDALVVHFDVDAIDYGTFPLADCPRYHGGLDFDDAMDALRTFVRSDKLRAITVTEVNPSHDPEGRLIPRLVDGLCEALAPLAGDRTIA